MTHALDYAGDRDTRIPGPRFGYFALLALSILCLGCTAFLFCIEVSGDAYAPLLGLYLGLPLIVAQFLIAGVPAFIYAGRQRGRVGKKALLILVIIPLFATAAAGAGVVLSLALPRTHGSPC